ncbi:hypothetical protein OIO90_001875 [Microbotryomycetes sp. JL221]|nr:hypothetical protein OIO90_001875 [Microbotryomycetes sp. JL221]
MAPEPPVPKPPATPCPDFTERWALKSKYRRLQRKYTKATENQRNMLVELEEKGKKIQQLQDEIDLLVDQIHDADYKHLEPEVDVLFSDDEAVTDGAESGKVGINGNDASAVSTQQNEPRVEDVWVVLADFGTQIRPFCNIEGRHACQQQRQIGERMIVDCLREWATYLSRERDDDAVAVIGAVNAMWVPAVKKAFNLVSFGQYHTHLAPEIELEAMPRPRLPPGFEFGQVMEGHIDEVRSLNEIKHSHEYLKSRLSHSTAIFAVADASKGDLGKSRDLSGLPIMAASAFTHRDGSLGTMSVSPKYRRQGLATLVVQERLVREREWEIEQQQQSPKRALAHVGATNVASKGVMSRLAWPVVWEAAWCRIALGELAGRPK